MECRLYLDEVKTKIKAETIDQVIEWCEKRNLKTYNEGFDEYVLIYEFELAYDFEYILTLIQEYGLEWFQYYTNRIYKTHIPPSKIAEITTNYPTIKKREHNINFSSTVLIQSDKFVYTVKEAADALGVCTKTIRNKIKAGNLLADVATPSRNKHYRLSKKSLDEYLAHNNQNGIK